ncbi:TRAP-type C4-dicarboxylate transport system, small permease component [Thalassovita gelatinovora]|uniref:TRAP transporter small permease protein n=1 Tax=Thalassovita gelatinovora TaxID=53501 RepID=A0A0P1FR25_THAGE|nr:TRAP transporter small permease [Thalassovita gelatinovora]QIZ80912.1 TRAP transporter small permease [Thalassovita gelatinovora]CUH63405.1 TRAP-type C4-dicarboxylate transport system, small permease component [Thalassovita gelatinovora]SEQ66483.1 TRAP-type C4-dicarboxylate transport system, small permease component [Thalassovita gelatinovora]
MKTYMRLCAVVFGLMMTALCVVISIETILRKVFNYSLEGVDELSGYAIAIGAPLCFAIAAIEQSHIRINLLYMRLPRGIQATLNVAAASLLAVLSLYLLFFTFRTVGETRLFGSVAQTPWMTPLIWPQTVWLIGMLVFAVPAVWLAVRVVLFAIRGDTDAILTSFGPDEVEDELAAEVSDLEART